MDNTLSVGVALSVGISIATGLFVTISNYAAVVVINWFRGRHQIRHLKADIVEWEASIDNVASIAVDDPPPRMNERDMKARMRYALHKERLEKLMTTVAIECNYVPRKHQSKIVATLNNMRRLHEMVEPHGVPGDHFYCVQFQMLHDLKCLSLAKWNLDHRHDTCHRWTGGCLF